jgi:putative transposase
MRVVLAAPFKKKSIYRLDLEDEWGQKYALAIQSWKNNWDNLTACFGYPMEIRKIIYTTNTIENLNRGIRKYTKTKVQFNEDQAALKAATSLLPTLKKNGACPYKNGGLFYISSQN